MAPSADVLLFRRHAAASHEIDIDAIAPAALTGEARRFINSTNPIQISIPPTINRWRARALQGKQDSSGNSVRIPWNKLSPPEEAAVLAAARESPEWSSRQLATWITDHLRLSVGGSTVYRLLK